jgi:hypothetical protein
MNLSKKLEKRSAQTEIWAQCWNEGLIVEVHCSKMRLLNLI